MRKNIIKALSIISIFISFIGLFFIQMSRKLLLVEEHRVIENLNKNSTAFKQVDDDIVGYLEIERLNIKKLIKKGVDNEVLDQNIIGMLEIGTIGIDANDIILAGHNINEVFHHLHQIKINDIVKITTNDSCYRYKVKNILTVDDTDVQYLLNKHENRLTMITCTSITNKRLLILCDLISF